MLGDDRQRGPEVALVNPNRVHPVVAPYALDILATSLTAAGFTPVVVDLTFADDWRAVVREFFATHDPLLVGVTIRNVDTNSGQDQHVFLPQHLEIVQEIRRCSTAPVVVGGAAFSTMPIGLTRYFGAEYGVAGPGEGVIVDLARALAAGGSADALEGLIVNTGDDVRQVPQTVPFERFVQLREMSLYNQTSAIETDTPYRRDAGTPDRVDNRLYYDRGGLGIVLVKNGCGFECLHCQEFAAKSRRMITRATDATVDEVERLCALGSNFSLASSPGSARDRIRLCGI
jgi:radical SAM superfamily enzyme YgiQ (UPF0313 family)